MTKNDHERVILLSAAEYIGQLEKSLLFVPEDSKQVIHALIQSLQVAIEKRDRLSADEMTFRHELLASLPPHQREPLINQYSLGLGSDRSRVIFIGTEHAYNLDNVVPFALEACGLSILRLCGGKAEVVSRIAGEPWPHKAQFHIHPNVLYRVQETTRGQHTWKVLASIMEQVVGVSRYELLGGVNPGLGGITYQIELSAYPSKQSTRGRPPTEQRVAFLAQLLAAFRATSRVIIFHGKMWVEPWEAIRKDLSRSFLGILPDEELDFSFEDVGRDCIQYITVDNRRVLFTRALNSSVSIEYRESVAHLIKEMM